MNIVIQKLHILRHIFTCALIICSFLINTNIAYAGNKTPTSKPIEPVDYLNNMTSGNSEPSKQMKTAGNTTVGIGSEIYLMIRTVIFIMVVVFFIMGIIKIGIPGRKMREEGKRTIFKAAFVLLCMGAMAGFIGIIWSIGSSLLK